MTTMTPKSGVEITHYFHELVSPEEDDLEYGGRSTRFVVKSVTLSDNHTGSMFQ